MTVPERDEGGVSSEPRQFTQVELDPRYVPDADGGLDWMERCKKMEAALRLIENEVYGRPEPFCRRIAEDIIEVLGPAPQ